MLTHSLKSVLYTGLQIGCLEIGFCFKSLEWLRKGSHRPALAGLGVCGAWGLRGSGSVGLGVCRGSGSAGLGVALLGIRSSRKTRWRTLDGPTETFPGRAMVCWAREGPSGSRADVSESCLGGRRPSQLWGTWGLRADTCGQLPAPAPCRGLSPWNVGPGLPGRCVGEVSPPVCRGRVWAHLECGSSLNCFSRATSGPVVWH